MQFSITKSLISAILPRTSVVHHIRFASQRFLATSTAPANNQLDFNEKETTRILDLINTKTRDELASYDISKAKLNKIESWKQKQGLFNDLDEVLHLDGFSVKMVEKFCKSLLGAVPVKRPARKATSYVTPAMPESQIGEINSSVSISVGISSIFWSRLEVNRSNQPSQLTHWQHHDLKEKKLHLNDLIQRCIYLDYLIPQADCYVFENPQIAQSGSPGNADQVNINVQRAQLTAILGFALANRNASAQRSKANVFYLRRHLSARLFQHLIGTERISAEKTILELMRTHYNVNDLLDDDGEELIVGNANAINFPSELRMFYKDADGYQREFLGQTLLLNLAFVRLVLLGDSTARSALSRNSGNREV